MKPRDLIPRDLIVVAAAAALTVLIAGPLLHPTSAGAEVDYGLLWSMQPDGVYPVAAGDLVLSLEPDRESYEAGATPTCTLVATNQGKKSKKCRATVRLYRQEPGNPVARSLPMPVEVFTRALDLEVPAGESVKIEVPTDVTLGGGDVVRLLVQVGETNHPAGMFSVAGSRQSPYGEFPGDEAAPAAETLTQTK